MISWRKVAPAIAAACCAQHCSPHPIDAVVLTAALDGGNPSDTSTPFEAGDATSPVDAAREEDAGETGPVVWPDDAGHTANSDPWIVQNHDNITQMRPQVLLLDFANEFVLQDGGLVEAGYDLDTALQPLIREHVEAFEVASQYQGYKSASAPAFLEYQVKKIVDLRDNNGQVNSGMLPTSNGSVDYGQLNSDAFAKLIDIKDAAGNPLNLCQLFTDGVINEVWGMAADPLVGTDPPTVKFAPFVESKQGYDADGTPTGDAVCTSVDGMCIIQTLSCNVTIRFFDFNPGRGAGCHLFTSGLQWPQYLTTDVLPAFTSVARTFFNFDFDQRFGAPFMSFFDTCPASADGGACVDWMSTVHATSGPGSNQSFNFSPMSAGCGNVVFPPNATGYSTQTGDPMVISSCENYGLHNGDGGIDKTTPYTNARIDDLSPPNVVTDCGGAQPAYLLESMPGLGTTATAADGTPMRNWWVYMFY